MTEYTPSETEVRSMYDAGSNLYRETPEQHYLGAPAPDYGAEFDRFLARVRRDAALHERQRIAGEVRLWASVTDSQNEPERAASLRAVADDIDRIPEETP